MKVMMKNIVENIIEIGLSIAWIANMVYAFKFWGVGHGLLNMMIPYAMIADLVFQQGRF